MIHAARALGLVVMLGCMIESSVGISAAAQFASLCDFVDLDGHLLIADDPSEGLGFEDGAHRPLAASRAGRGAAQRERARRDLRRGLLPDLERQGRPRPHPLRPARGRRRGRLAHAGRDRVRGRAVREQATCRSSPRWPKPPRSARECLAIGVAPTGGKLPPVWKAGAARRARARPARRGGPARRARRATPSSSRQRRRRTRAARPAARPRQASRRRAARAAACPRASCTRSAPTARSAR